MLLLNILFALVVAESGPFCVCCGETRAFLRLLWLNADLFAFVELWLNPDHFAFVVAESGPFCVCCC